MRKRKAAAANKGMVLDVSPDAMEQHIYKKAGGDMVKGIRYEMCLVQSSVSK